MNLTELTAALGWLVAVVNLIAIVILVKRTDDLETRLWTAERGDLVVMVRGTRVNLNEFLGRLTYKLKLDVVRHEERVTLEGER